ncbi:MAG: acyl-CoA dehydrogenase family protein [Bacteroidota bacterium]
MLDTTLKNKLIDIAKSTEKERNWIQQNRCLPDTIVQDLKATGIFKVWVAKAYGGLQGHVLDLMEAVQTLTYYNGSLGWVLGVTGTAGLGSGYLPKSAAKTIYGAPDSLTGGWAVPAGLAKTVAGGLEVSGRWSWGSGIKYCTHIVGGVLIQRPGEKRPISGLVYFEPEEVTFIDNWHVLGLHGSNSIDYEANRVFIPNERWIPFPVQQAQLSDTLYQFSFLGALSTGVASVGLGLAKRAINEIITYCQRKAPIGSGKKLAERAIIHEKVARMQGQYQAAKAYLESAVQKSWEAAATQTTSEVNKSELRLASAFAVTQSEAVVQQAYKIAGGTAVWQGNKLQELLQDMHMVTQHAMVSANNYETVGRVTFGQKVNPALL